MGQIDGPVTEEAGSTPAVLKILMPLMNHRHFYNMWRNMLALIFVVSLKEKMTERLKQQRFTGKKCNNLRSIDKY